MLTDKTISLIIPAWNEEKLIQKTISNLQNIFQELNINYEIIVVDNSSSDRTPELAEKNGVKVITHPERSIAGTRNKGASYANGDYLYFIDADTWPEKEHFILSIDKMVNDNTAGGGFTVKCDILNSAFSRFMLKYWNNISRLFKAPAGCMLFMQKSIFSSSGGFNEKVYASEEIWFFRKIKILAKENNMKTFLIDHPVLTSGRKMNHSACYIFSIILFSLFPFLTRIRSCCFSWYSEKSR